MSWGLQLCYLSVSWRVIQRKRMRPSKVQLAAYNCVHNKRMADRVQPTSMGNPQQYTSDPALRHRQSGTEYKNLSYLQRRMNWGTSHTQVCIPKRIT